MAREIGRDRVGSSRRGRSLPQQFGAGVVGEDAEFADQVLVVAGGLLALLGQLGENVLDPVDRLQNGRDRNGAHGCAVPELPDQVFGGVGQRLQPRQADEAAGAFDGVNQPEDVAQDVAVVGLLLEAHEFPIDGIEIFARLGQELLQQVVHAGDHHSTRQHTATAKQQKGL